MLSLNPTFSLFLVRPFNTKQLIVMITQGLTLQLMVFGGGRFERSYFDVRIFNPSAPSNQPLHSAYRRHDKEKRREYQQRVHEVENASFTPLIFTTTGGMGDAATQFYKRLANLLSAKHSLSYGIVMGWLRCKLSFSLLRSAIMCIRGARSSLRCPIAEAPIAVQVAEAHM